MGTWAKTAEGWRLTGGGVDTAVVSTGPMPVNASFRVQLRAFAHAVRVIVLSSGDARSCWECGIDPASTGNLIIRRVDYGVPAASVASAAHGIAAAVSFDLEVRVINGVIEGRINGSTAATISYDVIGSGASVYLDHPYYGFISDVDQALVSKAEVCELEPITNSRAEVLIAIAGGNVYASVDGEDMGLVASGVFNATGPVDLAEFKAKLYGVDGTHIVEIDPGALTATPLTASAGILPGGTVSVAGFSRMTIIEAHLGRLWLAGDPQDPQNVFASAIDSATDYDTGSEIRGAAFALTAAKASKIGQPIRALLSTSNNRMLIGCEGSIYELVGDPVFEVDLHALITDSGVSGKDSMTLAAEGIAVAHSPEGVSIIPSGSAPVPLTRGVLTGEPMQFPREDAGDYLVQVVRDTRRHLTRLFLTPRASGTGIHFAYAERVGGWNPGNGGWFPDEYPAAYQPTCSVNWRGKVLMGTREGWITEFDDAAKDDVGTAIESRVMLAQIQPENTEHAVLLERATIVSGTSSDRMEFAVYGAQTAQKLYQRNATDKMFAGNTTESIRHLRQRGRAPVVGFEIGNDNAGEGFILESVQVEWTPVRIPGRRIKLAAATIPSQSSPTVPAEDPEDPTGGPGGGGSGEPPSAATGRRPLIVNNTPEAFKHRQSIIANRPRGGGGSGVTPGSKAARVVVVPP